MGGAAPRHALADEIGRLDAVERRTPPSGDRDAARHEPDRVR
jgi:hypothetical protein